MTLPQVYELFDYWLEFPPTHELMAIQVGYKPPAKAERPDIVDPLSFARANKAKSKKKKNG